MLVTGGAGFIGSHLVEWLVAAGATVRVLDDLSTGRREHLAAVEGRCDWIVDDIRDPAACRRACEGVRLVFHQAALVSVPRSIEQPAETIAINVAGTANVLAAARAAGVARVVLASSSSVYGDAEAAVQREGSEGDPLSPYALGKAMGEQLASHFTRRLGLPTVALRYFNVYGPRQDPRGAYAAVVPRFLEAALGGEAIEIHGDGQQSRDFVFVGDVVTANLRAATAAPECCGSAYNVASSRATTLVDLVAELTRACGELPAVRHVPPRPGDVRHSRGDTRLASERLGFHARVPLAEGLARTLEAYRRPPLPAALTAG